MWASRNKMAIEKHLPKAPTDVIYIALSLMQRWSVNLKEKDQERISQVKDSIMSGLKGFKSSTMMLSVSQMLAKFSVCTRVFVIKFFLCNPVILVLLHCFLKSRGQTLFTKKENAIPDCVFTA
jgi:hypothetical protein